MGSQAKLSADVRELAVRIALERKQEHGSQWAAMQSIAGRLDCSTATLRKWVRLAERVQRQFTSSRPNQL